MMSSLKELIYKEIDSFVHRPVSVFSPYDQVSKVLGVLEQSNRYEVVVKSSKSVGIITIRDMLAVDQPTQTKVEKLWNATGAVTPFTPVFDVISRLVKAGIRALPVIYNDNIEGIISQVDIMNILSLASELEHMPIKDMVQSPVWSLEDEDTIANARRLMLNKGISHVPVTKKGKLVGIITADRLVHTFISSSGRATTGDRGARNPTRWPGKISGLMDNHPVRLGINSTVLDALKAMGDRNYSACLMVDEEDNILGILTPRELMEPLLSLQVEDELPIYIIGLDEENFLEKSIAEEKIRKSVAKSLKYRPDITEVSVIIKSSQVKGNRTRYDVTARALSAEGQINAKAEGWDLTSVFDELSNILERAIQRTKPERTPRVRRRGRR